MIATLGYYSAYVFVIWRTVPALYSIGLWYCSSGAIMQASQNLQQIFSTVSGIADQALFLTDLLAFFEMKPTMQSKPECACLRPGRSSADSSSAMCRSPIPEARGWC